MDPKAPVLPVLESGKCCRHVYCKSCITEWLFTKPLRSPTRFRPDGTFERMEVPCPLCWQPIKGLWPVLCGQVQAFEVKWGTDDLNLDLDDEVVVICKFYIIYIISFMYLLKVCAHFNYIFVFWFFSSIGEKGYPLFEGNAIFKRLFF